MTLYFGAAAVAPDLAAVAVPPDPDNVEDIVLRVGAIGRYGIDDARSTDRVLRSIATVLKPGGRLVIGWNYDKTRDPTVLPATKELFRPCALLDGSAQLVLDDSTMIYNFFEKV
jgi:hypothetical protein